MNKIDKTSNRKSKNKQVITNKQTTQHTQSIARTNQPTKKSNTIYIYIYTDTLPYIHTHLLS
jgi:hypothetical protein